MILSDRTIMKKIKDGEIGISPPPSDEQIQPSSIDLRLGQEFYKPIHTEEALDIKNTEPSYSLLKANAVILPPNEFILGTTIESVKIPSNLCARVEGRSSVARLGIQVECGGFIDSGFEGQITLEIKNQSNQAIILYENMRICQIVFEEVDSVPNRVYGEAGNKYQNQTGVTGSLIFFDDDTDKFGGVLNDIQSNNK